MAKISVVISTFNEEKHLGPCLESVKWADEIIVVDDGSTDQTVAIAQKYTTAIFHHKGAGYVEPARNFALSKAHNPWILLLDADERVPASLAHKLQELADSADSELTHVFIPRRNIIFNKWIQHTGWWPDENIRFFRKGSVVWSDIIHSVPTVTGKAIKLESTEENALVHYNYESVAQYLEKMTRYAQFQADTILKTGYEFQWSDIVTEPVGEFLSRFFARDGYKDGVHGLILSLLQAFSQIVVYTFIWEKQGGKESSSPHFLTEVKETFSQSGKDMSYWFDHTDEKQIKNPLQKHARKLWRKFR